MIGDTGPKLAGHILVDLKGVDISRLDDDTRNTLEQIRDLADSLVKVDLEERWKYMQIDTFFGFNIRLKNALKNMQISNISEVFGVIRNEKLRRKLYSTANFGKNSWRDLEKKLIELEAPSDVIELVGNITKKQRFV